MADDMKVNYIDSKGEGVQHIAFRVENIEEALAELKARGIRLIELCEREDVGGWEAGRLGGGKAERRRGALGSRGESVSGLLRIGKRKTLRKKGFRLWTSWLTNGGKGSQNWSNPWNKRDQGECNLIYDK